jgi:hypothetical protein
MQVFSSINGRLKEMRPYHEAFYPKLGLSAPKMQAEEYKGLFKFLPIAMYGLVPDEVTNVFAGAH